MTNKKEKFVKVPVEIFACRQCEGVVRRFMLAETQGHVSAQYKCGSCGMYYGFFGEKYFMLDKYNGTCINLLSSNLTL